MDTPIGEVTMFTTSALIPNPYWVYLMHGNAMETTLFPIVRLECIHGILTPRTSSLLPDRFRVRLYFHVYIYMYLSY